jgi:replicative DNA helicase
MSDAVDDFKNKMAAARELELMKAATAEKQAIISAKRTEVQYQQILQNEKDAEIARGSDYGAMSPEQVAKIQNDGEEYMKAAKSPLMFINESFHNIVPFFRKNLILVGGKTGEGKSTTVANIAYSVIANRNPHTGKTMRCLVLTNEERAEDFYNRVTSLAKGWHYTNHSKFTDEQSRTFTKMIGTLSAGGRLTVIDNNFNGSHGVTTSLEGIARIFDNLIAKQEWYDAIIIDYYQNIIHSQDDTRLSENDIQAKLTRMLDMYKNVYPAPIVLMAQIMPQDKDDKTPFQQRIKGRKMIMDATTFAMEMVADRINYCTRWVVHKSRFTESVGADFKTGYDYGKYVDYDEAFRAKIEKLKMDRAEAKFNKNIDKNNGIKDAFKKKED